MHEKNLLQDIREDLSMVLYKYDRVPWNEKNLRRRSCVSSFCGGHPILTAISILKISMNWVKTPVTLEKLLMRNYCVELSRASFLITENRIETNLTAILDLSLLFDEKCSTKRVISKSRQKEGRNKIWMEAFLIRVESYVYSKSNAEGEQVTFVCGLALLFVIEIIFSDIQRVVYSNILKTNPETFPYSAEC